MNKDKKTLYEKVYDILLSRIKDNTYPVRSSLPSEQTLQDEFNVSRITIRRAIQELEDMGLVQRQRGKLTTVLPKKTYVSFGDVASFSEAQEKMGKHPSSIILTYTKKHPTKLIKEYLQLDDEDYVYYLKRLRLINGRIICLHETYINPYIGSKIEQKNLDENTSIYQLYRELGLDISTADETIEARISSNQLKQELFLDNDEPIMYRERITYDSEGKPIEYSQNSYRANYYKYIIKLKNL